jgi:UDP-2,3-diacylglucosamine pyrophosphatase LpxH
MFLERQRIIMPAELPVRRLRTLFISDVHLGTRGCQAELLLEFLRFHDAETIYLVGDIIDGWRLRRSWYWPQSHNDVAQKFLRKARKGARVVYIPGNHDEFLRDYIGTHFGGIDVCNRDIHVTADGRRLLVIHGDQFDVVVRHARWLAFLGDWAYATTLAINTYVNLIRRKLGFSYWSLSAWAKLKVKNAVNFIGAFEEALAREARESRVDGVICGHIHYAAMHKDFTCDYYNCGDWVESCTALVEHYDGRFEIVRWAEPAARAWFEAAQQAAQRAAA